MKKIKVSFYLLFISCMFFASCASVYTPADQIIPEHIKRIYIQPVINATNQFGIEGSFTNSITDEFMIDGRLSLTNSPKEANAVVTVTIKRYILEPLTYDVSGVVEQYKLWVIVSASLVDEDNNTVLWTEPNLEGIQIYRDTTRRQSDDSFGDGMTEEDARQLIWNKISRNIVRRVIKGFGSITSISSKKVPA
ncbi:MAG: LPS assembly lipoprotein LptE [Endomicrobium sp.]|nr:LPS assembly lipoprotein LptE [Endomicrobium sp.]